MGLGVFAVKNIRAGTGVIRFEGEVIAYYKCLEKEKNFILLIGGSYCIVPKNEARFVNHSCNPNCEIFGEHLVAIKNIKAGEEITFAYDLVDEGEKLRWDDVWNFECKCGAENCRRIINKFVFRNIESQKLH